MNSYLLPPQQPSFNRNYQSQYVPQQVSSIAPRQHSSQIQNGPLFNSSPAAPQGSQIRQPQQQNSYIVQPSQPSLSSYYPQYGQNAHPSQISSSYLNQPTSQLNQSTYSIQNQNQAMPHSRKPSQLFNSYTQDPQPSRYQASIIQDPSLSFDPLTISTGSKIQGISELVDQTLRNLKFGGGIVEHEKRDQNFYYDNYINLNGIGTYKKFHLKPRKTQIPEKDARKDQIPQNQLPDAPLQISQMVNSLIEIGKGEQEIELIKNQLVQQQDYNIPSIFTFFDKNQSGKISLSEFIAGQKDFGGTLSQTQSALIFCRVLPNSSSLLLYEQFEQLCIPLLGSGVNKNATSRRVLEKEIGSKTIDLFRRLINSLNYSETLIESLRKRLSRSSTKIELLYRDFNIERNGKMTISELDDSLKKFNDQVSSNMSALLFYRICRKKQTQLSLDEFESFCYGVEKGSQIQSGIRSESEQLNMSQFRSQFSIGTKATDYSKVLSKFAHNSKLEGDIEQLQKSLFQQPNFSLYSLFVTFRPSRGLIDAHSFSESLKNIFQIPLVDTNDVLVLFRKVAIFEDKRFKINQDIDFKEFCSIIVGRDLKVPKGFYEQSSEVMNFEEIPNTFGILQKLFKLHLNNEVIFNEIRFYISVNNISIQGLFNSLCNQKSFFERVDFDSALRQNGSFCTSRYHDLTFQRFDPKLEGIADLTFFTFALKK